MNKSSGPDDFTVEYYQTLREEENTNPSQLFQRIKEEGTFSNSFYKVMISKSDIDTIRKNKPIFLMNSDAKIPNKILVSQIQ